VALLVPIVQLVQIVLGLYWYVIIASVIMSWLVTFGIINTQNRIVYMIGSALNQMTEPAFRRIRQYVPIMGGVDLSPIVLLLALWLAQTYLGMLIIWMINQ